MGGQTPDYSQYMYRPNYDVMAKQMALQRQATGAGINQQNALMNLAAGMPMEQNAPNIFGAGGANEQAQQIPAINTAQSRKLEQQMSPETTAIRAQLPKMIKEDIQPGEWQKRMDDWSKHQGLVQSIGSGLGDSTVGKSAFYDRATAEGAALRNAQEGKAAQFLGANPTPVAGIDTAHILGAQNAANLSAMQQRNQRRNASVGAAGASNQSTMDWVNQMMGSNSQSINAFNQGEQQYRQGLMKAASDSANSANAETGSYVAAGSTAAVAAAFCWVARAAFGTTTDRWLQFRNAMFKGAPDRVISLYCKYGERVAKFVGLCSITRFATRSVLGMLERNWA